MVNLKKISTVARATPDPGQLAENLAPSSLALGLGLAPSPGANGSSPILNMDFYGFIDNFLCVKTTKSAWI